MLLGNLPENLKIILTIKTLMFTLLPVMIPNHPTCFVPEPPPRGLWALVL